MKYFLSVITVAAAVLLIAEPRTFSSAVGAAVGDCLEVIVPSLFAFTVLAAYLQRSGLYRTALRPLTLPLSRLLRTDEELCAVFVLANAGGYPVGVNLLAELVRGGRLSEDGASRMLCCCFGSGPAFIVGIVGVRVFGSVAAGLSLFAACFLSSLVMAFAVRSRGAVELKRDTRAPDLGAGVFVSSVTSGARVMFTVCAMITGFSAITALLGRLGAGSAAERLFSGLGENAAAVLPAMLEVTRVKDIVPAAGAFPLCAALLSLGGACVALQLAALSGGIPLKRFLISRLPAAALSALFAFPLEGLLPPPDVQTLAGSTAEPFTKNAALSVCVLIMCGILLLEVRRDRS